MASTTFHISELQHDFADYNLKLVTCCTLQITLPHSSTNYQDLQELIKDGLWITRGNGLSICIQSDLGAMAHLHAGRENFADGLINVLCAAKLWAQLSLKVSRIAHIPVQLHARHQVKIYLGLSHSDSLYKSLSKVEHALALSANIQDVKPPAGIAVGFLNSIELLLNFVPITSPGRPLSTRIPDKEGNIQERCSTKYDLRLHNIRKYAASETSESSSSEDHQDVEDFPLFSPDPTPQDFDIEMLDRQQEKKDDLLFMDPETTPTIFSSPRSPLIRARPEPQHLPSFPQHPPSNLDILKLIDASLRHTISGTHTATRTNKKPTQHGIELAKPPSHPSLAAIAPSLFRPGYMKAVSSRAPLLPRIASSLSAIISHPRSRAPQPHHHDSDPPQLNPNSLLQQQSSLSTSEIQPLLWRLLQARKWPTVPLEPLDCTNTDIFQKCERDGMMLFSGPSHDSPPSSLDYPLKSKYDRYRNGGARNTSPVKVEEAEDEDEDMLDTYRYQCNKGEVLSDERHGEVDAEDEDLFPSFEGTPFASQEMDSAEKEEMLDDGDWEEDVEEMEMGLLLEEEQSDYLRSEMVEEEAWRGRSGAGDSTIEGVEIDALNGMDDELGWGMLF